MSKQTKCLNKYYNTINKYEIGIDEAGRGPMFGRVYAAAVILPKDESFNHSLMKDSKKFSSEKKIIEVSEYIKENAIKWGIGFSTEREIDDINIRNATHNAMHNAIKNLNLNLNDNNILKDYFILVDGRDFKQFVIVNDDNINIIPNICIEQGDNKYSSIAAASILAKVERDKYIKELCLKDENLDIRYNLLKNKGYGTKDHINGIKKYGITNHHRKSFGICKNF